MKLSEYTLSVLKNFASINSGLVIQAGNKQRTMSPEKSILVEVELEESFTHKFAIYDLTQFLGNITTLNNPDLEFNDKFVKMSDGVFDLFYIPCSPELIISPPDKSLSMDSPDVTFNLSNSIIAKTLRLASMNGLPNLSLIGKNGSLDLRVHEKSNDTSNYVSTRLMDYSGDEFTCTFSTENFKIMPDDYEVQIKNGTFGKFQSKTKNVTYFIALETK
jgi:hypothetical protein